MYSQICLLTPESPRVCESNFRVRHFPGSSGESIHALSHRAQSEAWRKNKTEKARESKKWFTGWIVAGADAAVSTILNRRNANDRTMTRLWATRARSNALIFPAAYSDHIVEHSILLFRKHSYMILPFSRSAISQAASARCPSFFLPIYFHPYRSFRLRRICIWWRLRK